MQFSHRDRGDLRNPGQHSRIKPVEIDVDRATSKAPPKPGLFSRLVSGAEHLGAEALHGLENAGKDFVNGAASFGNAAIHHPGELAAAVGGAGLTVLSAAGEGGGLLLDATGVGAIAGVPLNTVSAAGMATGVGISGASIAAMAARAAGDDHVEPLNTSGGGVVAATRRNHRQSQQGRPGRDRLGPQQFGMEDPVNVVDEIPEPHRGTFVAVLQDKDPALLQALRASALPTLAQWETVEETFIDALSEHYGPGHEPDVTGKRIDNALGAFMTRWPNDELAQPGR